MSKRIREVDVTRKAQLKDIAKLWNQFDVKHHSPQFRNLKRLLESLLTILLLQTAGIRIFTLTSEPLYESNPRKPKF